MVRQRRLYAVTATVLLLIFIISLDTRAVGTAMPTAVAQLGELPLYSWVFAAFMIASTTTVPLFGRLSDMYGRKYFMLIGTAFFLVGSVLCGRARSMQQLVLFRGVQGIGAGALKPLTMTVLADIFPLERRARLQSLVSGSWGSATVVGPLVAGFLVDHAGWRWIFYLTVPLGLLAGLLLLWSMDASWEREGSVSIDYAGALILTAAIVLGLLGLLKTDRIQDLREPHILGLLGSGGLLFASFVAIELRSAQPLVPLEIFRNRIVAVASISGFLTSLTIWSTASFIPLFVQGVLGTSAIGTGTSVTPLMLVWVTSSSIGGGLLLKWGYRVTAVLGLTMMGVGTLLLIQLGTASNYQQTVFAVGLVGFGGMALTVFLLALQNAVGLQRRGIVTAASEFTRGLGGAIGISLTGSLLNSQMATRVAALLPVGSGGSSPAAAALLATPQALLDSVLRADLPEPILIALRTALAGAFNIAFLVPCIAASLALLASLWLPGGRAADHVVPVKAQVVWGEEGP